MKPHFTLLKNARLIDCKRLTVDDCDVLIKSPDETGDSEIINIQKNISVDNCENVTLTTLDVQSHLVSPSFIDMHCHLREPGTMHKDTIAKTAASAIAGGFGCILAMPEPVRNISETDVIKYIVSHREKIVCDIAVAAPVFNSSSEFVDFGQLSRLGAVAFTDEYSHISDSATLKKAFELCASQDALFIVDCNDTRLADNGVMNDGAIARHLKYRGIPKSAEEIAVAQAIILAGETDCRVHLSHISTKRSFELIRNAKHDGINVTCEVAPYQFSFTESDVMFYGAYAKTIPPLRSEEDRAAVIDAIIDGTVDCICSDHCPNARDETALPIETAPFGMVGLQTVFCAGINNLVIPGYIDIYKFISMLTENPARILGIESCVKVGAKANLNVLSIDESVTITEDFLKSKGKNTAFLGTTLQGSIQHTIINGIQC